MTEYASPQPHRQGTQSFEHALQINSCIAIRLSLYTALPNFARACGCVLVGGSPDKRPEKRQSSRVRAASSTPYERTSSRRRKPAAPPEAGDAAQSNDGAGFFGLCRVPSPATEEACPSCRACGRDFPYQAMALRKRWLRLSHPALFDDQRRSVTAASFSSPGRKAARVSFEFGPAFPPCGPDDEGSQMFIAICGREGRQGMLP